MDETDAPVGELMRQVSTDQLLESRCGRECWVWHREQQVGEGGGEADGEVEELGFRVRGSEAHVLVECSHSHGDGLSPSLHRSAGFLREIHGGI